VRTGDRATTNTTSRPGRIARFAALIGLLAACSLPASAAAAEPTPSEAAELGRQAYDYGFPLLDMLRIRHGISDSDAGQGRSQCPNEYISVLH